MNTSEVVADLEDPEEVARISDWLSSWDPTLSIVRPPRDALLYEQEATLYGFAVATSMSVRLYHRERTIGPGDAIVVPAGLVLDVEPWVDLLAVNAAGPAPDHFRERFIQVWGYDHFPSQGGGGERARRAPTPVLPPEDLRYRMGYAVADTPGEGEGLRVPVAETEPTLVLVLGGPIQVRSPVAGLSQVLQPGQILGIAPGLPLELRGTGRAGLIRPLSEPVFHARRALQAGHSGRTPSPEATPRRHNPSDHQPFRENPH